MAWKKVSNSDAGDSSHFGGDDIDKISLTFNAETQTDPINIKDENLYVVDPADTSKKVRFDAGGVTSSTTRVVTLPDGDITVASTTAASTSVAGLMSAADKTKLDAIEASATADQTDAQIRAAVEAATDSNVFTDADHSKLNAIEASATADQTNAEIAAAVEAASDSNTFTDADHSKLNAIEASADVTDATNVDAAGALMLSDTTTAGLGIVIDEDAMGSNLATKVPTQQSVKAYVDSAVASNITLKGNYDASSDSPSLDDGSPISGILAGDHYVVSVAGTFFTEVLQAGDSIISKQDSPTTLAHWITVNNNMVTPVVTAGIADDAITLAKMASGTDGNLITYDASGNPAYVATGNANQVLTSNGAGAAPTFQAAAEASPLTTKGDVYVYGSGNARLPVGADGKALKADSSTATGLVWGDAGGSAPVVILEPSTSTSYAGTGTSGTGITVGTAVGTEAAGVGQREIYIRKIDTNNEGVFTVIHKNGAAVEVQIA